MFRSLAGFNYRVWFIGALVSNIGTWMQRTAQDWLVLTMLTDGDATAVGITMALQFGPQLVLLPLTGMVADRFDKRATLIVTQSTMGALGLALGILTLTGALTLPVLYVFALALGVAAAFDAPARQAFVSELVDGIDLTNAVALNSASFNGARLIGPAVAGVLIALVGTGWVFIINAATFVGVLSSLIALRTRELHRSRTKPRGGLLEGFRYVGKRPDLITIMVMAFLLSCFGLNFPIFTSTMAVELGEGSQGFGLLSSAIAVGSVAGALLAAKRAQPKRTLLIVGSLLFAVGCALAAAAPAYWFLVAVLPIAGIAAQSFLATANGLVQLTTAASVRGRVMALYMAVLMGATPIGAPLMGWVADAFGPRWALAIGGGSGIAAGIVGVIYLVRYRGLRLRRDRSRRLRLALRYEAADRELATTELAVIETETERS